MMRSTLYFLLAVLFVLVALSASAEEKPRKSDDVVEPKRRPSTANRVGERERKRPEEREEEEEEEDHENVGDDISTLTSYANNRYAPVDNAEGNHRPRSRWQGPSSAGSLPSQSASSLYDDFSYGHEGSRSGFGNEGSRSGFGNEESRSGFGNEGSRSGFGNEGSRSWFGNEGSRSGFGNVFQGPSSSMSYENNPRLNSGPVCHSLIDPQYAIFSDVCGAVPQARYSLPNPAGHRERWQVAQILSTITSASTDSACTRSLRLLLCPVLFPPCPTRHEPTPVLPCQSYCRAVKARCSIPALDIIPCEALPLSSDICPTNQPYGSFIPPNSFPPMQQPFPTAGGHPQPRQFPSLQSLLSSHGGQQGSNAQHPMLTPSHATLSAAQTVSPSNLYNNGPFNTDTSNPMVADYRQAPRYAPYTRSSHEVRPTNEVRPSTEGYYQIPARGPVVKA